MLQLGRGSIVNIASHQRDLSGYIDTPVNEQYWSTMPDPSGGAPSCCNRSSAIGTPDEIAWPAVFLASDEASFITGASMMVDGGRSVLFHE